MLQWLLLGSFTLLLHHFYTTAALSLMKWHGVLWTVQFEKPLRYGDIWKEIRSHWHMKSGHRVSIPNFIYSYFSFICNGFLTWGDGFYTKLCKQRFVRSIPDQRNQFWRGRDHTALIFVPPIRKRFLLPVKYQMLLTTASAYGGKPGCILAVGLRADSFAIFFAQYLNSFLCFAGKRA